MHATFAGPPPEAGDVAQRRSISMPTRPFAPRMLAVALAVSLAACADLPTSSPDIGSTAAPPADEPVALSLDELASQASLAGDEPAAGAYADGALAIRLGAVPTEIAVSVGNQQYRYWAVVIGIIERAPDGAELLTRRFVAWTGEPRPTAALRTLSRSDAAVFGAFDDPTDVGRATGSWVDFVRDARFTAVDGTIATILNSIAGDCPNAERDPRFSCQLARFDVRLDGTFELAGDVTARVNIATAPPSVAGIVVRRTDGGRGGRPAVTPSRPMATRK